MVKSEKLPFGYTYRANNLVNDKNYIGQTVASRWLEGQNPIEERWKEEVNEAIRKSKRGENLRYIENAIVKYGPENFQLIPEDVAFNQEELDAKETKGIKDYDSMNPDKGYNLKEGGRGGRLSELAKENLSRIGTEKWQNDQEYRNKQTKERQERAINNPEWHKKMTEINKSHGKDPEWRDKVSRIGTEKWQNDQEYRNKQTKERQERAINNPEWHKKMTEINKSHGKDPEWRDKVSKAGTDKWQNDQEYRNKQLKERKERAKDPQWIAKMREIGKRYRKEIPDKYEFLKEIQGMMLQKDMLQKYNMGKMTFGRRIQEMFGPDGPKNYTELKQYLKDKNIDEVLKEINERSNDTLNYGDRADNIDKKELLRDIKNMDKKEILDKYNMNSLNRRVKELLGDLGVNDYSQATEYLKDKDIDDVLKDIEKRNKEKPEFTSGEMKDKKESKLPENLMEKNDKSSKREEKEELEGKPKEEKDDKSEKAIETTEVAQPHESEDEISREKEEKSGEIEEESDSPDKEEIHEESSNIEEVSNSKDNMKKSEDFDNLGDFNLTSNDYSGIDKDSIEKEQDIKDLAGGHDGESSESMDHVDDKSNEFDDFNGLGEDQGRNDSEFITSLNPPINKESNESEGKKDLAESEGGIDGGIEKKSPDQPEFKSEFDT